MHHVALNPDNFSIAIFNLTVSERIHLAYVVRHQHSPHIFAMWLDRGIATIRLKYEGICVITTAHRQFETCISDCATGIAVYSVTIAILAKMNRDCIIFRALDGQCQLTERRFSEVSKNTVFIIDDRDRFLIFFHQWHPCVLGLPLPGCKKGLWLCVCRYTSVTGNHFNSPVIYRCRLNSIRQAHYARGRRAHNIAAIPHIGFSFGQQVGRACHKNPI